jgi:hypothetical protein
MPAVAFGCLILLGVACASSNPSPSEDDLATRVAATLRAITPVASESNTPEATQQPTSSLPPTETPTNTPSPPEEGVSLNCDGTYQRVRLINDSASGPTLTVDRWVGDRWQPAWDFSAGDPDIRHLTDRAGAYSFGGCQRLIVLPVLYSGSGAVLNLRIFEWVGDSALEVYSNDGTHGDWQIEENRVRFIRSLYLFQEPNCCPCNREAQEHEWNGIDFTQVNNEINPTYTGTPPPICRP